MTAPRGPFQKANRLLQSRDFKRVQEEGTQRKSRNFVLFLKKEESTSTPSRLGVTVSRRVGNAVTRNRLKRLIREWFRQQRIFFQRCLDIVVIARHGAGDLTGREVFEELDQLIKGEKTPGE